MAQIVFNTVAGIDGTIQLRDNPFMDFWRMAFKMNKRRVPIRSVSYTHLTLPTKA